MSGRFQRGDAGWGAGAARRGCLRRRQTQGGGPRTGVGMGRVALGLSSAVCVGMRLIELPALLLLICKVGLGSERDGAWRTEF